MYNKVISEAILELRRKAGWKTQAWLAGEMGCSPSKVQAIEAGQKRPNLDELAAWCERTGLKATVWYPELAAIKKYI